MDSMVKWIVFMILIGMLGIFALVYYIADGIFARVDCDCQCPETILEESRQ